MNKIVRLFLDTDMRNQHEGLIYVAAQSKINLKALDEGEHVLFLNKALNKMKLYSHTGVLTYQRQDKGKFDLNAIQAIPQSFDRNGRLDLDKALRTTIEKKIKKVDPVYANFKYKKTVASERRV